MRRRFSFLIALVLFVVPSVFAQNKQLTIDDIFGPAPIVPPAGRTLSPAEIVQLYKPGSAVVASHVQSTFCVVPAPLATRAPVASETVTFHGSGALRRAWKRTGPPMAPRTDGA